MNTQTTGPTKQQDDKMQELMRQGYIWNKGKSIAAAGVILEKGNNFYFFGMQGEIMHNPEGMTIKL